MKVWEPDDRDTVSIVFLAEDGLKSRFILKIGTLDNEKVLLYYQSETSRNVYIHIYIYKLESFIFGFIISYFFIFLINELLLNYSMKTHGNKKTKKID